jgi:hypothetical protein
MKQITDRKGTGGVQLNGNATTALASKVDKRCKEACNILKQKYNGKHGITVWKTMPLSYAMENGFMKKITADGGMWFINDKLFMVIEGKTQQNKGNAIERWADNYLTTFVIDRDVMYITFGEGEGFKEDGVCYRFAQRMMELEERLNLNSPAEKNKSYRNKEFDVLYDKGQSWFINNNFTTEDMVDIMEDIIKDAIKNNKE